MTISYKWISEYIPVVVEPEKLSRILTSIGLEVESMEAYQNIKGGLQGLLVGEVLECWQHPGADKLKLTKVDTGGGQHLQIVCGAPNVAVGQKVIVATAGTTIYPLKGEPVTMKTTKIRGEESAGMICAEDEVGIGERHDGIVVLPAELKVGTPVSEYYKIYNDWIYEIGLTPNRMDAMSHLGVARDVCAYLSQHENRDIRVKVDLHELEVHGLKESPVQVEIENQQACRRYAGIYISGIRVGSSPGWLQERLRAIGQRTINNIVDITNYVLHDTGQPLHAFDADKIGANKIIVKNLSDGTTFKTLDEKEIKLSGEDLMICDGNENGLCIAGVFGGWESGVKPDTRNILLESAWFSPIDVRKTSFRHGLRTDAATRFEKSVDISQTFEVMQRAARLICELAGGKIEYLPVDVYPSPEKKKQVALEYAFIEKLSGKKYSADTVKRILTALGFELVEDGDRLLLAVPYSKPDISLQADVVEEIMRIDGYDNIEIPTRIKISPSVGSMNEGLKRKEKTADFLVGAGFSEIFTNSITNGAYFEATDQSKMVRLLNNLSAVHNVMRPSMLETGLESISYNLNRKNSVLRLFEFGKTYENSGTGIYNEEEHLCLYVTGSSSATWKGKERPADLFYMKGVAESILKLCGMMSFEWQSIDNIKLNNRVAIADGNNIIAEVGAVSKGELQHFDIRQDVFYTDIRWINLLNYTKQREIRFAALPNQLPVTRDIAMVVGTAVNYGDVEKAIRSIKLEKLKTVQLFDVFESEKLGTGKKSLAISVTFLDDEKTLTDKEIESMMVKIRRTLEESVGAEIRKGAENTIA